VSVDLASNLAGGLSEDYGNPSLAMPNPRAIAARFEQFKGALDAEWRSTLAGETRLRQSPALDDARRITNQGRLIEKTNGADLFRSFAGDPLIQGIFKGASADVLQSVQTQINAYRSAQADIMKDITTTSPLGTGLVPFDLEVPMSQWAAA
jgi:hypothetical protein